MNRAFVSENDGWGFCQEKRESCMFADEKGRCCLPYCRLYGQTPPASTADPVHSPPERPTENPECEKS